jgi:hypothetical protein
LTVATTASCDVGVTDAEAGEEAIAIARVVGPESPIVAMAASRGAEVLWIEGVKDRERGVVTSVDRVVYGARVGGHDSFLSVRFDARGLPVSAEDGEGNVLHFANVDLNTGLAVVSLIASDGAVLMQPTTVSLGATRLAELAAQYAGLAIHLTDPECDQRDQPNLLLIDYSIDIVSAALCVALIAVSATPVGFQAAVVFCGSAFIGLLAASIPDDRARILSFLVDAVQCTGVDAFSCGKAIWTTVRSLLSAPCSFVGGAWKGWEHAIIKGSIDIAGTSTPIDTVIGPEEGTIVIEQRGCDVQWKVAGFVLRSGDVSGNDILVRGPAAQLLVGTVLNERLNQFTAHGRVCGDIIIFVGSGRYTADVQTVAGNGTVDISVRSDAILVYQAGTFFGAADRNAEFTLNLGATRKFLPSLVPALR